MVEDKNKEASAKPSVNPGDVAAPSTLGTGEDTCPICGGPGQTRGRTCSNCGGSGKVIQGIGGG